MSTWTPPPPDLEGFVTWHPTSRPEVEVKTYYRVNGKISGSSKPPVICVPGGPGASHHYMLYYTQLVASGIPVILYDEIGCGQTTRLIGEEYNDLWVEPTFIQEMEELFKHFDIQKATWVGQSWGAYLVQHYAILHPDQIESLVVWSGCQDIPETSKTIRSRLQELPEDVQKAIAKAEKENKFDTPEYESAVGAFFTKFVVDMEKADPWVQQSTMTLIQDPHVYHVVQGPSEFTINGTMKDLTLLPDIHKITCPVLMIDGTDDEMHGHSVQCAARLTGSKSVWRYSIQGAKHLVYGKEAEEHMNVVKRFLAAH